MADDPAVDPKDPVDPVVAKDPVDPKVVPPAPKADQGKDWRDDRIAVLTARLREEQRKNAVVQSKTDDTVKGGLSEDEVEARVAQRAPELAAQMAVRQAFDAACNAVAAKGKELFPDDFNARVGNIQRLRDVNDPQSAARYDYFLQAAIETGAGAEIIHALGEDMNEANRIINLSPVKMAVELTKLAAKVTADDEGGGNPKPSNLPKPITPVGDRGRSHEQIDPRDADRSDRLSTAEWMKRRNAQIEKDRKSA